MTSVGHTLIRPGFETVSLSVHNVCKYLTGLEHKFMAVCAEYKPTHFMDTLNTTTDTHAVTKFVEPEVLPTEVASFKPLDSSEGSEFASIAEFLGRPVLQTNQFWNTTQTTGKSIFPLASATLPSDGTLKTFTMWNEKLKGYNLVSADINYRIQLNTAPTQQGRLIAYFTPFLESMDPTYGKMHNYDITTMSMQPSVQIDARSAGAVLTIPYLAPTTHYELNTGINPVYERGRLGINIMSPLKTGATGSQDVEVSVWTYFTNVKLKAPIVPQSSGGKMLARPISDIERDEISSKGRVSGGLMKGASITASLAAIPMLTEVMAPTSWAMAAAAGVAAAFGYSKPDVDTPPVPVTRIYDKYMATSDGVSPAVPLAATVANSLELGNYSYTPEDEMSMAFLLSREAMISEFTFAATDLQNTVLYTTEISPTAFARKTSHTFGANTQTVSTGPPVAYLAQKFKYWKGSLKLRFSLVRTEMQSGRIQITFTPTTGATPVLPTVDTGSYAIREIVDISTDEDIELVLPFLMPVPYQKTGFPSGKLEVRVVNQLRHPAITSSEVDFLVFASAGEDFEFAYPCNGPNSLNVQPFVPQSGAEDLSTKTAPELVMASACVGEVIKSTRQLIRPTYLPRIASLTTDHTHVWHPFAFSPYSQTNYASPAAWVANLSADNYNFVAGMFALYRGGMDAIVLDPYHEDDKLAMIAINSANMAGSKTYGATFPVDLYSGNISAKSIVEVKQSGTGINRQVTTEGLIVAAVPFYNRFPVALVNPRVASASDGTVTVSDDGSQPEVSLLFRTGDGSKGHVTFGRRIREDFQFSLYIGCPPWVESPVST
uniref:Putative ORF2 n=1 Tax=Barns Ness breadcrumb sponge dicistro-like virus 2 TaxID=2021916 RepID=A0A221LFL1_9VIRU|nr:putative ORF2 [Barns Ness breadcrumb sponge dicistro-like virus 2]